MLEFLVGIFVFGGAAFWSVMILASVFLAVFVEENNGLGATITMLISLIVFNFLSGVDFFSWTLANLWTFLFWVASYIALGMIWSGVKWTWSLYKINQRIKKLQIDYSNKDDKKQCFFDYVYYNLPETKIKLSLRDLPPKMKDNKSLLANWTAYWPWSLLGTIICDWVKNICRFVVVKFSRIYQAIADYIFKDTKDIFKKNQID